MAFKVILMNCGNVLTHSHNRYRYRKELDDSCDENCGACHMELLDDPDSKFVPVFYDKHMQHEEINNREQVVAARFCPSTKRFLIAFFETAVVLISFELSSSIVMIDRYLRRGYHMPNVKFDAVYFLRFSQLVKGYKVNQWHFEIFNMFHKLFLVVRL